MSREELLQSYPWITSDLLASILSREIASPATIIRFTVRPAIEGGENFSSQLIRVRFDYEFNDEKADRTTRTESWIVKASLGEKLLRSRNVFAKEIEIFTKIIPAVERSFRDHGLDIQIGPKYCEKLPNCRRHFHSIRKISLSTDATTAAQRSPI